MAQPCNVGGGEGGSGAGSGSTGCLPLLLGGGSTVSRLQKSSTVSDGRSNSPQNGYNKKFTECFVALKKITQQRSSSDSSSSSSNAKEEDKKSQNGATKSTNGKEKPPQNESSATGKDQKASKSKDKVPENKEKEVEKQAEVVVENKDKEVADIKESQSEAKKEATTEAATTAAQPAQEVFGVVLDDEVVKPEAITPSKDSKSTRKAGKSPVGKATPSSSPAQKKQAEIKDVLSPQPQEDVDMESLTVDASPIRSARGDLKALSTATSTPGRSGFRSSSNQSIEVKLPAQPSSSPVRTPARTFAQIRGRRSIHPINALTPSKVGSNRCVNSDLDTSRCTNASMNATVSSEVPNSSSFSFSFFERGRKRERTAPPDSGSQSTNDLAQDVEMSPPKRASVFSPLSCKFCGQPITRCRSPPLPPSPPPPPPRTPPLPSPPDTGLSATVAALPSQGTGEGETPGPRGQEA